MGNAQSCIIASLSVCSVYLFYAHIYRSHSLLQTNVICSERLPSFGYLFGKYLIKALTRRPGDLYTTTTKEKCEVAYTVLNCRLETPLLRRFCSASGYGWDYPDSEYRDIPLCFPELLCLRLMLMVLSADSFRLSPAGLVRVRQSLKTLQPIDELKKGPFTLHARVLEYRPVDAGVEVDIRLSATSRSSCPVWESVLTLLSKNKFHKAARPEDENKCQPDGPVPADVKRVEIRVPWSSGLRCAWSFSDYSPHQLLSLPARLFGCRAQTSPSLWMLSVCLAEIEKHKGVKSITAPINVAVQFKEPLSAPGKVVITFWETPAEKDQSSAQSISFHMEQHGSRVAHMVGFICRT
ncbi:uncharacterized protein [Centroberyx affinis]|uniref:uncharacterized protein isoform X1 n=2 Tax=Centroberyx affinis TaxID=166261 RepID=UPI003A5BCB87